MKSKSRRRCLYCGAVLKRDMVGLKCPTRNCQWEHGVDEETYDDDYDDERAPIDADDE